MLATVQSLFDLANQEGHGLYKVHAVASGAEALAALAPPNNLQPDVILLDIMMDGERGDVVLPKIRELYPQGERSPKIVMASILSHVDRVQNLFDLGADGYLVKPIAPNTIKLLWRFVYPPDDATSRWLQQGVVEQPLRSRRPSQEASGSAQMVPGPSSGDPSQSAPLAAPRAAPPTAPLGGGVRPASAGGLGSTRRGHRPIRLRPSADEDEEIGGCKQQ